MPRTRGHHATQQEQYDAMSRAIASVLFPVMICMALAVYLVHSVGDDSKCEDRVRRGKFISLTKPENVGDTGSSSSNFERAFGLVFVAIFIACVIMFTFVLVFLYKRGHTRVIFGWLLFAVSLILGYIGGLYLFEFCRSHCVNVDWVTLVFVGWNFAVTGLLAIFATVPRIVNQAYLIVMSALMAYVFRRMEEWTTWSVLLLLVVWDLFAVLSPCGPLKKLVAIAQERGHPLPALVYDTNPNAVGRDPDAKPAVVLMSHEDKTKLRAARNQETKKANAGPGDSVPAIGSPRRNVQQPSEARRTSPATSDPATADEQRGVGTMGSHLKLGLGDFVFYSILVGLASQRGAMTTVTSFVAILTGLCATLFLVTVYRKPLPALPLSILLGLVFYFLTRYTVQPFVDNLLPELLFH